jgi:threonine/homoserine/homoserine lactone efflux protein
MSAEQIAAFLGFAIVVAGTPGPSNTLLTATAANVGVIRGLPALAGVAVGMAALMFFVALGLGAVLIQNTWLLNGVKWTGAAVLLWLAWQIGTSCGSGEHTVRPIGFFGAAAFQWINPKSWLACASAAAGFLQVQPGSESAWSHAATLAVLFSLVAVPCCFVWLAFGAVVQRALRSERAQRTFNLVMGGLLAASVLLLLLE